MDLAGVRGAADPEQGHRHRLGAGGEEVAAAAVAERLVPRRHLVEHPRGACVDVVEIVRPRQLHADHFGADPPAQREPGGVPGGRGAAVVQEEDAVERGRAQELRHRPLAGAGMPLGGGQIFVAKPCDEPG